MRFVSNSAVPMALACLTATVALVAQAADYVKPNVKPGLWEITHTPQISGEMSIPPDQLAKMTPEQRTRFEAAMKQGMANAAKPRVFKDCMTEEKIAKGFDLSKPGDDASCKRKIVSSSATELTFHDECDKPQNKTVSDAHFDIKGGTQVNGKVTIVMTGADGKTMTVNSTLQGKWISASCGAVKDAEVEK